MSPLPDTRWRSSSTGCHQLLQFQQPKKKKKEEKVDMIFTSKGDLTGTGQVTQTIYPLGGFNCHGNLHVCGVFYFYNTRVNVVIPRPGAPGVFF